MQPSYNLVNLAGTSAMRQSAFVPMNIQSQGVNYRGISLNLQNLNHKVTQSGSDFNDQHQSSYTTTTENKGGKFYADICNANPKLCHAYQSVMGQLQPDGSLTDYSKNYETHTNIVDN